MSEQPTRAYAAYRNGGLRSVSWPSSITRAILARGLAADDREDLVAAAFHLRFAEGLEVQAKERLGVRRSHVEVPVSRVDREAVQMRNRAVRAEPLLELPQLAGHVGHARVDLAGDEVPLAERPQRLAESSTPGHELAHEQKRARPGVGLREVAEVGVRGHLAGED